MSKSILLCGNIYGAGNIGDDAIAEGILRSLATEPGRVTIATHSGERGSFSAVAAHSASAHNRFSLARAIRRSGTVICGGGTLVAEELGLNYPLKYVGTVVGLSYVLRRPVYLLSVGANVLQSPASIALARAIFELVDGTTIRDAGSRDALSSIGIDTSGMAISGDPAVHVTRSATSRSEQIIKTLATRASNRYFFVNVVNEIWKDDVRYKASIAAACDYAHTRYGLTPVFICNEVRAGDFFDFEANRSTDRLRRAGNSVVLPPTYLTPGEMVHVLSTGRFNITMRLHGAILGAIAEIPSLVLPRAGKVSHGALPFALLILPSVHAITGAAICDGIDLAMTVPRSELPNIERIKRTVLGNWASPATLCVKQDSKPRYSAISLLRLLLGSS